VAHHDQADHDTEIRRGDGTALPPLPAPGRHGQIPLIPVGRRRRIDVRWVEQWLADGGYCPGKAAAQRRAATEC
jgi:hypothetical protein